MTDAPNLNPCPYCGESFKLFISAVSEDMACIACSFCGLAGPFAQRDRDAIKRWNSLPRQVTAPTDEASIRADERAKSFRELLEVSEARANEHEASVERKRNSRNFFDYDQARAHEARTISKVIRSRIPPGQKS